MEHLAGLLGTAVALFASTNVDDLFILLAFFADRRFKVRQVVVGQCIGIGALYAASVAASLISLVVPAAYIGLLGLAPIVIGLKRMWGLRKGTDASGEELQHREKALAGHGNVVAVAAVTMANGADNLSIYTPWFAMRSSDDIALIGVVFALMTMVWLGAAYWLTDHRSIGAAIRQYGHRLVPFVLIALGALVLYEAGTVGLLHR